jgi:hypothetical protein
MQVVELEEAMLAILEDFCEFERQTGHISRYSIHQYTSAYLSIRQHTSAYLSILTILEDL